MMPTSLLVTGSIAYDHLSRFTQPFESILLPDQLHKLSVCFFVPEKTRHFGGTAGNIAYSLALLGASPRLFGAVGPDFELYEAWMKDHGISTEWLQRSPRDTACATIITDPNANQIAEFYPGAMATPVPEVLDDLLSGIELMMISPEDPGRMKALANAAQTRGIPYFFDPGQNLGLFSREELENLIGNAAGVFLNDYEWELTQHKLELPEASCLQRAPLWVLTRGEQGSTLISTREGGPVSMSIPPVRVDQAVNPTGCGDAYRAGFLKGYLEKRPLEVCGKMGSLLGAEVVQRAGTQDHKLTWDSFARDYERSFSERL